VLCGAAQPIENTKSEEKKKIDGCCLASNHNNEPTHEKIDIKQKNKQKNTQLSNEG
jgi:hypothetical protein